jgi:hypothetical protein
MAALNFALAHREFFLYHRDGLSFVCHAPSIALTLPAHVRCGIWLSLGIKAAPAFLSPLRHARINVNRVDPVHDLQAPVRLLIPGLNQDKCTSPAYPLSIGIRFVLRYT